MKRRGSKVEAPPSNAKRCAIYTRKSTSAGLEQEFNSLDAQREACAAYIHRQERWILVDKRYDDGGFTGANTDRPAFQRLLVDIDAGRIDVVLVYKVDRLSRSLLDFAQVMERFNTGGAAFVSVTQNFSTADAMGRLTLNMLMSFAEFEREMIGERTRDKIAASRRKGMWTGGHVPLGYTVVDKKLVVNEFEAVLVREIFALYGEHRSALAVVRALKDRPRLSKRWRPRSWTVNDVLRVLKNPTYAGYAVAGDELYDAAHSLLVDRGVFARTQAMLKAATKDKQITGRNPDYLLRGVLRCACCGSAFTPASTTTGGTLHRYYRCGKHIKEGKDACPSSPLRASAIEAYVVERLQKATLDEALATEVTDVVRGRVLARRRDLLSERQLLPPQIASISAEVQRLVETLADLTGAARRHVAARLHAVGEQLTRTEARLAASARELANLDAIEVEASWVTDCLADFDKIWDVLTPHNRGRLLRAVIERVEVDQPANEVRVFMTDLSATLPPTAAASAMAQGAPP